MLKILKYSLLLMALLAGSSCASKKPDFGRRKKPATHHPNLRKAPSGYTDNCDCAKGKVNVSRIKQRRKSRNAAR